MFSVAWAFRHALSVTQLKPAKTTPKAVPVTRLIAPGTESQASAMSGSVSADAPTRAFFVDSDLIITTPLTERARRIETKQAGQDRIRGSRLDESGLALPVTQESEKSVPRGWSAIAGIQTELSRRRAV